MIYISSVLCMLVIFWMYISGGCGVAAMRVKTVKKNQQVANSWLHVPIICVFFKRGTQKPSGSLVKCYVWRLLFIGVHSHI